MYALQGSSRSPTGADRRLNIVDDHLLYGWAFFALVLFVAGYAGSFFADSEPGASINKTSNLPFPRSIAGYPWRVAMAGSLSLLVVVAVFVLGERRDRWRGFSILVSSQAPLGAPGLAQCPLVSRLVSGLFKRRSANPAKLCSRWRKRGSVSSPTMLDRLQGREMIAYDNRIVDQTQWSIVRERRRTIDFGTKTLPFAELVAASGEPTPLHLVVLLGGRHVHGRPDCCQASRSQGETFVR